jgi:hypothetical protein
MVGHVNDYQHNRAIMFSLHFLRRISCKEVVCAWFNFCLNPTWLPRFLFILKFEQQEVRAWRGKKNWSKIYHMHGGVEPVPEYKMNHASVLLVVYLTDRMRTRKFIERIEIHLATIIISLQISNLGYDRLGSCRSSRTWLSLSEKMCKC